MKIFNIFIQTRNLKIEKISNETFQLSRIWNSLKFSIVQSKRTLSIRVMLLPMKDNVSLFPVQLNIILKEQAKKSYFVQLFLFLFSIKKKSYFFGQKNVPAILFVFSFYTQIFSETKQKQYQTMKTKRMRLTFEIEIDIDIWDWHWAWPWSLLQINTSPTKSNPYTTPHNLSHQNSNFPYNSELQKPPSSFFLSQISIPSISHPT